MVDNNWPDGRYRLEIPMPEKTTDTNIVLGAADYAQQLISPRKPRPYANPNRNRPRITPQKLDRKVLATIREGAKKPAELLTKMSGFEPGDLRISLQRLLECKKVEINKLGEFVYTAGKN